MRAIVIRASLVLLLVVLASGAFFEWVLVHLIQEHGDAPTRLEDAFFLSLLFDVVLVCLGAVALSWPLYRKLLRLRRVVQQQQRGDLQARANFKGEDSIAQLAQAFDALADINAQQIENQRSLLHAVSHELRTPLARLRFSVEQMASAPIEGRGELREQADADMDELDALVDEVLIYARASPGGQPREIERFDLCELLEAVRNEHPASEIIVQAPDSLVLRGEPRLLRRAVSNLVRNAVRYAKRRVTISAKFVDGVEIKVRDDGPGLPPQADKRLFLPFVRYGEGGVGLGTSIAHAIAERHRGSLDFSPRVPGQGAEFVLMLPASVLVDQEGMAEKPTADQD